MRNHEQPHIGHWYEDGFHSTMFKVVALDKKDNSIQMQHFDGEIEEMDKDIWDDLELFEIAPPEDWSGPFEIAEEDLDLFDDFFQQDGLVFSEQTEFNYDGL